MTVSGTNLAADRPASGNGYRWSGYPLIWGWATWARAWRRYDGSMSRWPDLRAAGWLDDLFADRHAVAYWTHLFDETYERGSTWDYAWVFASWLHGGLSAVPDVNLVTNVGFRADATHTREGDLSPFAGMPVQPMGFPLVHPAAAVRDAEVDEVLERDVFSGNVHRMFERLRLARRMARVS
jgi:hypothetical protein